MWLRIEVYPLCLFLIFLQGFAIYSLRQTEKAKEKSSAPQIIICPTFSLIHPLIRRSDEIFFPHY